jgi:hypothetical protein
MAQLAEHQTAGAHNINVQPQPSRGPRPHIRKRRECVGGTRMKQTVSRMTEAATAA